MTVSSTSPSAAGGARTTQVAVGGLTFDVVLAGPADGRPVVLLHGFPQSARSWRHVVPALVAAGHRVIAPDQRGYSPLASPDGVADYAGEHLVADVLGLLDALGITAADLVGHDWGAAVAWQAASLHPERVTTLTAISVPHPGAFSEALGTDADQREKSAYMRDFARPGFEDTLLADDAAGLRLLFENVPEVDVQDVLDRFAEPAALRRALNWYSAQSGERMRAIPHTPVPTLHLWSDRDAALGEYGARATERYVDAPYELVVLRGVSHWIPEQAPDAVAEHVLRHLARHP